MWFQRNRTTTKLEEPVDQEDENVKESKEAVQAREARRAIARHRMETLGQDSMRIKNGMKGYEPENRGHAAWRIVNDGPEALRLDQEPPHLRKNPRFTFAGSVKIYAYLLAGAGVFLYFLGMKETDMYGRDHALSEVTREVKRGKRRFFRPDLERVDAIMEKKREEFKKNPYYEYYRRVHEERQ